MNLSDKIFIREAIEFLKFQNKPVSYVVNALMNEESISTYFDVNVNATKASGYYRHPTNEDDVILYVDGAPPSPIEGPGKKILEADVEGGNEISVYRFEHKGTSYCGADSEGTNLKPIVLGFDAIYFNDSEFRSYQDVPAYQDKNHEHYAPELDLAIQLHKAVHIDKYGNQSHNRVDRVTNWLNANCPDQNFSNAQIDRLSATIRIDKPRK
jgi:hypothetical protein